MNAANPAASRPEQRPHHRLRGEREDAERDEVDEELLGRDRPHAPGGLLGGELRLQDAEHAVAHRLDRLAARHGDELLRALRVVRELAQQVARQVRTPREVLELVGDDVGHLLGDREIGAQSLQHARKELAGGTPEHHLGEPVLGAEVVVQHRVVHVGLARDLLHAGAGGPVSQEDGVGRVEDALLGGLGHEWTVRVRRHGDDL
jgi:hypothetical protein